MAPPTYAAVLAAVPVEQIDGIRGSAGRPSALELVASHVEECPHDLVELEVSPLDQVLAEAIDIGQPLRNDLWHPLRAPIVVDPETVTARAMKLEEALATARAQLAGFLAESMGAEIDKVRRLYAHASRRGEAVVTFLAAAGGADAEGALVPRVKLV